MGVKRTLRHFMPPRPRRLDQRLPSSNHFHGNIVAALVQRAAELNVDSAAWFHGLRMTNRAFVANTAPPTLSHQEVILLLHRALAALPGEGHGLELGSRQSLADFGVLGLAMLAAPTFGEALRTGIRFAPISGAMLILALDADPAGAAIIFEMHSEHPSLEPYLCEEFLASSLNLCRAMLGPEFKPERIELRYPAPRYSERYQQLLGGSVLFGCADNRLVLAQHWLDAPMPAANPAAARQLKNLCDQQMPPGQGERIASTIEQRLALDTSHAPALGELARELHMTERTLRRQLQAEHTSYRALLDRVRERNARRLLFERELTLTQIASAVGFADVRDFRRAFKRWTGHLPRELRHTGAADTAQSPLR